VDCKCVSCASVSSVIIIELYYKHCVKSVCWIFRRDECGCDLLFEFLALIRTPVDIDLLPNHEMDNVNSSLDCCVDNVHR